MGIDLSPKSYLFSLIPKYKTKALKQCKFQAADGSKCDTPTSQTYTSIRCLIFFSFTFASSRTLNHNQSYSQFVKEEDMETVLVGHIIMDRCSSFYPDS